MARDQRFKEVKKLNVQKSEEGYFSRPFIYCVLISAVLIISVLVVAGNSGAQATIEEATQTQRDIEAQAGNATAVDIFVNNAQIALISFLPVIGPVWMVFVQYNTGYAFGNLAKVYGIDYILVLSSSLADPIGLLENSAYILAMSESIMIVYSALEKKAQKRLLGQTWKTVLAVVGLLVIGAIIEAVALGRPLI